MMARGKFYRGTVLLALAGFFSKLIGAVYRIPLARLLGAEGMGLYQMAYPVYTMLWALSAAGVPVAVSLLVTGQLSGPNRSGARRVLAGAMVFMAFVGALFSFLVYRGAAFFAHHILHEPRASYAIVAISPAVFFASLSAVLRGYFQGFQEMGPTASSQVVEQVVRVATVLALVYYLLPYGLEMAAAGAAFGAVTGAVASFLLLCLIFKKWQAGLFLVGKEGLPSLPEAAAVGRRLMRTALPLSLGGMVLPLMQVVDASIVPLRLQEAGLSPRQATEQFGQLAGMAATLMNLPAIIPVALATSLVPVVYEAYLARHYHLLQARLRTAVRITLLLMIPAAVGLWVLATPISRLLYDLPQVGRPLRYLAPGVLAFGLYQVCAGGLQGLGKTYLPAVHLLVGVLVKSYLSYWLVTWPFLGINGAALATVAGFGVAFWLNYRALQKLAGFQMSWAFTGKPALAAVVMAAVAYWMYAGLAPLLGNNVTCLLAVAAGALTYAAGLLALGAVEAGDLEQLHSGPFMGKIIRALQKLRLLR